MKAPLAAWLISSRCLCLSFVAAIILLCAAGAVQADTLAEQLHQFIVRDFPFKGFPEAITPLVQRLAVRGIDFPVTAVTPSFTYVFNFDTGVPERSLDSLGPVFTDRVDTVGKGWLDLELSYIHANLTQFEGEDFSRQLRTSATVLLLGGVKQGFAADDFSLVTDLFSFSASYGITDRFDVNMLVPIAWTSLDVSGRSTGTPSIVPSDHRRLSASAFGIGDVLLRSKYRVLEGPIPLALNAVIHVPTGNENDFQSTGDTTVLGGLICSRSIHGSDVHGSVAVELNGDDLQRSRARYALGVALQPWQRLALLFDVIGSSSFVNDEFHIPAPPPSERVGALFGNDSLIEGIRGNQIQLAVPRSDVVDLALGVKVNIVGGAVGFVSAILPITTDGLRAEIIPAAGIDYGF